MTVALIDTGVDLSHPDLKKRIVLHENFVADSFYKPEIHGTAVAGIIGATWDNTAIAGVCKAC